MSIKQTEKQIEKERKSKVTVSDFERKEAYNRGYRMCGTVKCLHHDTEFTKKLYKMSTADNIELSGEWNKGFQDRAFGW